MLTCEQFEYLSDKHSVKCYHEMSVRNVRLVTSATELGFVLCASLVYFLCVTLQVLRL